jgi:hypothetical protein
MGERITRDGKDLMGCEQTEDAVECVSVSAHRRRQVRCGAWSLVHRISDTEVRRNMQTTRQRVGACQVQQDLNRAHVTLGAFLLDQHVTSSEQSAATWPRCDGHAFGCDAAYYNARHGDGQTQARSAAADVGATTDFPKAASHPFYRRLNQLLREHDFDDFVDAQCAGFYAETMGRPGPPPGTYSGCC